MGFVWLVQRPSFGQQWRGWAVMLAVTAVLAVPLIINLQNQPEAEGRVEELAVPLVEAPGQLCPAGRIRGDDFEHVPRHRRRRMAVQHSQPAIVWRCGAVFFWGGVLLALLDVLRGLRRGAETAVTNRAMAAMFLLLWWLAGIAPAFISVPPASLGHTILSQPATYILAALPIGRLIIGDWRLGRLTKSPIPNLQSLLGILAILLLIGSIAVRDLPDYFQRWPERGMVRFLYRADIQDVADYVNSSQELTDFGISGLLAGPWDRQALKLGCTKIQQFARAGSTRSGPFS
ncbi:MAG: hypothetical protein H6656_07335 [Ardenticatenaceae bacterium]|nr:hypothetical protein [Ardenticatenaceae bacterium]